MRVLEYNYVGKILDGRYEIQEVLGVGGMAIVYLAYDNIDDRPVAVKILKEEYLANEEFRRRFKNESKAIAMLSHPNIVKVYDVSYGERLQYIVMEYVEGITLKEYIEQRRVIPWKEAVHFLTQILRALQHAHDRGVVHRDIKPQNILLLHSGNIKVTDFGIARLSRSETRTMGENAIGSVHYISPEQAKGDFTDGKTDIYSVGVVLYEMLTGELPFQADSTVSVAIMQLQTEPRRPREVNDQIPLGLEQITIRAMQKNPADRYQSAAELLLDLEEFKRNPLIRFEYAYYVDKEPTKYVSPLERQKYTRPAAPVPLHEEDDDEAAEKSRAVPIMLGILIGLIVVLGGAALLWYFGPGGGGGNRVTVERFIGKKQTEIEASKASYESIYQFNFVHGANGNYAAGVVYDQNPASGSKVTPGADGLVRVTLYVVQDIDRRVPDVRGMLYEDAKKKLDEQGFVPRPVSEYTRDVEEGKVIRTDPKEGTPHPLMRDVIVYVANGQVPETEVPDLIGWDADNAKELLESAKLKLDPDIQKIDSAEEEGKIVWQSHDPKTKVALNTRITVKVSNGKQPTVTFSHAIPLPSRSGDGLLKIYLDGTLIKEVTVLLDGGTYSVALEGSGPAVSLQATLEGSRIYSCTIDFTADPPTVSNVEDNTQPVVPNVLGKTEEEAIAVLNEAGYEDVVTVSGGMGIPILAPSGTVRSQSPRQGTRADYSTQITLEIYD